MIPTGNICTQFHHHSPLMRKSLWSMLVPTSIYATTKAVVTATAIPSFLINLNAK